MADWIVQTRGKYRGRIGVIVDGDIDITGRYELCRFGSGGPTKWLRTTSFRKATQSEIAKVMGCRPRDLPEYLKKDHPE